MSRTPLAFMSYVNLDDKRTNGNITDFRERLSHEVSLLTGEAFDIFQDKKDIALGQQWEERINDSLDATIFLIPIITPAFFKSDACRKELERFLKREEKLDRGDLIVSIYYVTCPVLKDEEKRKHDPLAKVIAARQYMDWTKLRLKPLSSVPVRKALAEIAEKIVEALERTHSVSNIQQHETKPAPIAKTELPTVVVDQRGNGDYTTITEALKAVKAGGKILVRPGVYEEGIVIDDKTVEIIGDGERSEIVIEADGKPAVLFKAAVGRIANLTLRQGSSSQKNCVNIAQGRLDLEDCDISSQGGLCVAIYGSADPRLRRNRIHDGKKVGVLISENGQGMLEDNEIIANAWDGVGISEGGKPTLRRNRIFKNSRVGIRVWDKGGGIFEENDFRGNAKGAWFIEPSCEALVQRRGNLE